MTVKLYVAPAGHGKTRFAVDLVRRAAEGLQASPRVCVANYQQALAWERRLAAAPGTIGVHIMTFDDLYAECLSTTNQHYTRIEEVVQYRLLHGIAQALPLKHYGEVRNFPGFIQECRRVIDELKSAQISPDAFLNAVRQMGDEARLREIGDIYAHYQRYLQDHGLSDWRGLGWLALEALASQATPALREWDLLVLDGFASFTQTQLSLLRLLRERLPRIVITLTGSADDLEPRLAHRQFTDTRVLLEKRLGVRAEALPVSGSSAAPGLAGIERNLFQVRTGPPAAGDGLSLITVSDHAAEVRAALRWLKECIVAGDLPPHAAALTVRDLGPFRPYIMQVAEEYGLPVFFVDGVPLHENPCIAAFMDLLRMMLPVDSNESANAPALPRRAFIGALRSPYFDWAALTTSSSAAEPVEGALAPDDVEQLDMASRWGRVIGGYDQWSETLERLAGMQEATDEGATQDEYGALPHALPRGQRAAELLAKLHLCIDRLNPPAGRHSVSDFVRWLEELMGSDATYDEAPQASNSLNMLARVRLADAPIRYRDLDALRCFKEILRGLIWAEQAGLLPGELSYRQFFNEIGGAVEAAVYHPGARQTRNAVLVSNVIQGRGVPCRALAVMGMAEGLFPAPISEDPFLREADRDRLRSEFSLPLEPALQSFEQEYFYETVARPWEKLLFTRPAQAETGASWEPSPFWTEVRRLLGIGGAADINVWSEAPPPASPVELLERAAEVSGATAIITQHYPSLAGRWRQIESAAVTFKARWDRSESPFNGALHDHQALLQPFYTQEYLWSASRLERYATCPHFFFLSDMLQLQLHEEPEEGLDARQLGNIYHRLFEQTYRRLAPADCGDPERLIDALHAVAPGILDGASQREGFRETAWWRQTREEILHDVEQSLSVLARLDSQFVPTHFERFFGRSHPLILHRDGDVIRLRGVVDRVDVDEQDRLRIIDYKTASPHAYDRPAHNEGKRLQIPLYALAVQEALGLGMVVDGFYWHVRHAERSRYTLAEDANAAMTLAASHVWRMVDGARQGRFMPEPPSEGCPSYCPGAAFCWRYRPRNS